MEAIKQKILAFKQIHREFKEIIKHDKCRTCTCFHTDVLSRVQDTLKGFNESEPDQRLDKIEADFERWIKAVDHLNAHG